MASLFTFCTRIWNDVVGLGGVPPPDDGERQYLDNLRPKHSLRKPARLPNTPTKAHRPPTVSVRSGKTARVTRKCPHCSKTIYFNAKDGRVSKPKVTKPRMKNQRRFVTVRGEDEDDEFLVEDWSPTYQLRPNRRLKYS